MAEHRTSLNDCSGGTGSIPVAELMIRAAMSEVVEQQKVLWDHPDFPDVIDYIEKIGDYTKEMLIAIIYDESGEGLSKKELRSYSRGRLLALAVDSMFGGSCTSN